MTKSFRYAALKDAISCVKSNLSLEHIIKKSYNQRKDHTIFINNKIWSMVPKKNFNMDYPCYCGFCGPWIETLWVSMKKKDYSLFDPFIPLFVPWLAMWHRRNGNMSVYINWRNEILNLISKDYFYITLSQNDDGIEGRDEAKSIIPDNLIIISSGGKGHIPILLFLSEYNPKNIKFDNYFKYELMFAGRITHHVRQTMINNYSKLLGNKFKFFPNKINWKREYMKSKFICAPRGWGRNSFRLTEILQSSNIPVYLYNDIIWLPYYDSINWSGFSVVTNISNLHQTINKIINTSPQEIKNMKKKILSLHDSHFTVKAVFNQIKLFLLFGFSKSDLRCSVYSSLRG